MNGGSEVTRVAVNTVITAPCLLVQTLIVFLVDLPCGLSVFKQFATDSGRLSAKLVRMWRHENATKQGTRAEDFEVHHQVYFQTVRLKGTRARHAQNNGSYWMSFNAWNKHKKTRVKGENTFQRQANGIRSLIRGTVGAMTGMTEVQAVVLGEDLEVVWVAVGGRRQLPKGGGR